jgi:ABC-2 type transport system permease protein
MVAKVAAHTLIGMTYAAAAAIVALLIAVPWLMLGEAGTHVSAAEMTAVVTRAVVAAGVGGALGVGAGTLMRNPVVAILATAGVSLLLQAVMQPVSPIGALSAFVYPWSANLLPVWAGGLVLAGWALVVCLLANRLVLRRDLA